MRMPDLPSLQRGDPAAWDQAYDWLWPIALAAARRRLAHCAPDEAEDVAVMAITGAAGEVAEGRVWSLQALQGLVVAMAHRRAVDLIRRRAARGGKPGVTVPYGEGGEDLPAPGPGLLDGIAVRELAELLAGLLDRLTPEEQELVRACYLQGMKQREAAAALGLPLGTVGVKLSRTMKKLRELIEGSSALAKEFVEVMR